MDSNVKKQYEIFEKIFANSDLERWGFHDSKDPLIRYLRDRRIRIGIDHFFKKTDLSSSDLSALVICGGVGGEGTLLANLGFGSVTVSDFSESALRLCELRDKRLTTINLDAEKLDLDNCSFDVVFVQDGLHHLSRPILGFTEMLRVANKAVIVIEPHTGIVANLFGQEWECQGDTINFVFRWNRLLFEQVTKSYLLKSSNSINIIRLWDHNVVMRKIADLFGGKKLGLMIVQSLYGLLNTVCRRFGNMMIGVVIKDNDKVSF